MKIVISIPVHESAEVVINQINNVHFFVPDSIIVLHVSKEFTGWGKYTVSDFEGMDNVLVNPVRFSTSYGTGILVYLHMLNFLAASSQYKFDFFNLHSSNELFIKPGLADYLKRFDAGFFRSKVNPDTKWGNGKAAFNDRNLKIILNELEIRTIYGSQTEGTFYNKSLFNKICSVLRKDETRNFSLNSPSASMLNNILRKAMNSVPKRIGMGSLYSMFQNLFLRDNALYAKEEIYFATIASKYVNKNDKIGTPYTYFNMTNNLVITKEQIIDMINDTQNFIVRMNVHNYDDQKYLDIFSVKRVPRRMDDPVRKYVENLIKK